MTNVLAEYGFLLLLFAVLVLPLAAHRLLSRHEDRESRSDRKTSAEDDLAK